MQAPLLLLQASARKAEAAAAADAAADRGCALSAPAGKSPADRAGVGMDNEADVSCCAQATDVWLGDWEQGVQATESQLRIVV